MFNKSSFEAEYASSLESLVRRAIHGKYKPDRRGMSTNCSGIHDESSEYVGEILNLCISGVYSFSLITHNSQALSNLWIRYVTWLISNIEHLYTKK